MSKVAHDIIALQASELGSVMDVLSKMLRAMFVAGPNKILVGGDFSQIEARINGWMAGEQWLLDEFAAGRDMYRVAYAKSFGLKIEEVDGGRKKGPQRSIGKTQILACGYQGSVGAWLRFNPDPTNVAAVVKNLYYGQDNWRKASEQHAALKYHNGLPEDQWIAVKLIINAWREAHPKIVQSWWTRQDCAIQAVESPETKITGMIGRDGTWLPLCNGRVSYMVSDGFLWARLPSGKLLAYANPRLVEKKDDWLVDEEGHAIPAGEMSADEIALRIAAGAELQEGRKRLSVCYDGKSQKAGKGSKFGTQYLYGGLQCNNDCQGTARELLRFAMANLEREGYPIVLHVHDEAVSEVPEHLADSAKKCYAEIMSILPSWLEGLPVAAESWTDKRYVK